MANTDIRLLLSFRNHPKTKKLRLKLGDGGPLGFIFLLMFAAESKTDGVFDGMDEDDIALAADYRQDPQEFCDVLVAVRFLDFDGETYSIHDWKENNPYAAHAEIRSERGKKGAKARWEKFKGTETEKQTLTQKNDASSTDKQSGKHEQAMPQADLSNAPTPTPTPTPAPAPKSRGARKRGTRLPKDWQPSDELKTWAIHERPDLDMQKVIDSFTDYWIAKTGQAATKLDWEATFRNWVRNEKPNGSGKQNSKQSAAGRQDEAAARQAANL